MAVKEDSINRFGESSRTFNLEEQSQSKRTQDFLLSRPGVFVFHLFDSPFPAHPEYTSHRII